MSATSLPHLTPDLALPAVCRPDRSLSTFNLELSTSFFSTFQPSNAQTLSLSTTDCSLPTIFFRINTCKSLSKQTTLTLFRNIDLQKTGGRGVLWLTRHPSSGVCPERPSGVEGSLPFSTKHVCPESAEGGGVKDLSCYPIRKGRGRQFQRSKNCPILRNFS